MFLKNPRTNFLRQKVWRVIFWIVRWCECYESQGLWFFRQYYCLRRIFWIGRYLEAVRRKIMRVIRRFFLISTFNKENINARRNKSYYFLSFFKNFIFHNSHPACVAKESIFSSLNLLRKCSGNSLNGKWILSSGLINYL